MRYTVIGAGHGGQALAGYLALQGERVILFNRTEQVVKNIINYGGLELKGCVQGKISEIEVTSDLENAVTQSDVIMICIPSNQHIEFARKANGFFKKNQIIVLNPGRTLGAYFFAEEIHANERGIFVAETDTFLLTARKLEDGVSKIFAFKKQVYLSAENKETTNKILKRLNKNLSMLQAADSMIYTSLSNIGAIFHPLPAILNIGRIECGDKFLHYKEGISPTVCNLLEKLDFERVELARHLGCNILSAKEWIHSVYGSNGNSLYEVIQNTDAYNEVTAPQEISTRYIYEDIATGIVPMFCMAREVGSECKVLGLTIELATEMLGYDFLKNGRADVRGFIKNIK